MYAASVESFDTESVPRSILASASTVLEQSSKLGAGQSVGTVAEYEKLKVAHFEGNELVVHLVGDKTTSTGVSPFWRHCFGSPPAWMLLAIMSDLSAMRDRAVCVRSRGAGAGGIPHRLVF